MKIILEGLFKNTLFKEFIDDYGVCIYLFYDQFFCINEIHFGFLYRIQRMLDKIC